MNVRIKKNDQGTMLARKLAAKHLTLRRKYRHTEDPLESCKTSCPTPGCNVKSAPGMRSCSTKWQSGKFQSNGVGRIYPVWPEFRPCADRLYSSTQTQGLAFASMIAPYT